MNEILLQAKETRRMTDTEPIAGENEPWQKITVEAMGGKSLLELGTYSESNIVASVLRNVTIEEDNRRGWNLRTAPLHQFGDPFIADIIEDSGNECRAIMEWRFGIHHLSGQGGNGDIWKEARTTMPLSSRVARSIARKINRCLREAHDASKKQEAYQQALREENLDDESIGAQRQECLKRAGLDGISVGDRIRAFKKRWEKEWAKKKAT